MKITPHGRHVPKEEFFYVLQNNYDEHAEIAIPGYIALHHELGELVARQWKPNTPLHILDLGTGTGKTLALLLDRFPESTAVAVDVFDEMLYHAERRLNNFRNRIKLQKCDFSKEHFGENYDLCVSALAIHHQDPEGKKNLFLRIYESLNPGGCFCMIDWIKFKDPRKEHVALEAAKAHVRDVVPKDIAEEWVKHWCELNIPDTVEELSLWLREAGFSFVFCPIRHYGIALIYGIKEK